MVTVVDPHLKRDKNYFVYREANEKGYLLVDKDGTEVDGWCWPGSVVGMRIPIEFLKQTIRVDLPL